MLRVWNKMERKKMIDRLNRGKPAMYLQNIYLKQYECKLFLSFFDWGEKRQFKCKLTLDILLLTPKDVTNWLTETVSYYNIFKGGKKHPWYF